MGYKSQTTCQSHISDNLHVVRECSCLSDCGFWQITIYTSIWRFPKMGPPNHPFNFWIFHYKHSNTIFREIKHPAIGVPPSMEPAKYWLVNRDSLIGLLLFHEFPVYWVVESWNQSSTNQGFEHCSLIDLIGTYSSILWNVSLK